jgi:hypothetical protein
MLIQRNEVSKRACLATAERTSPDGFRGLGLLAGTMLLAAIVGSPALGAQINYGSHMGNDVTYVNVTEDSGADEPLPLFGPPTVTGNSIDFNPLGFDATSGGVASDITDSNLVFMVVAKPGMRIDSMTINEAGDTTQAGNVAPGSMGTSSAVFASGVLDIHEVDFQGINHISVPFSFTFSPSGGTYFLGTDGGGGPIYNTQWTGSVTLDIEAILIANGIDQGATKISIDMDNTLVATSQLGTTATIAKKDLGGFSVAVMTSRVIPEPSAGMLAAFVLAGPAGLVYRRQRHSVTAAQ